jgi:hypothetical protein
VAGISRPSEAAARTIQLGIEYDPAPPFDSGHPDRAPEAVKSALSARYQQARSAVRAGIAQAAARHEWLAPVAGARQSHMSGLAR